MRLLFVYGTLRPTLGHPLAEWLSRAADPLGKGVFQGRLYDVGGYPGAVASKDPGDHVHGEIWVLKTPEATLSALDAYEGCGPDDPEPTEFVRRAVHIERDGASPVQTWIYLYNRPVDGFARIASGDYLRLFLK